MIGWRERAKDIRARQERRRTALSASAPQAEELPGDHHQQAAFAKRVIREVLAPVLSEFVSIVKGTPAMVAYHESGERTLGVTCDLNSSRFTAKVHLLAGLEVRLSVFLTPSQAEAHCRDFSLSAPNAEIEAWFGDCLTKLYENQ